MQQILSGAVGHVRDGRVISLQYRVRLANGQIVESTREAPMDYLHGGGQILPALEQALEGLLEGERAAFSIAPEDAYGARDDDNLATLPKGLFPDGAEVEPGVQLLARAPSGQTYPITVREVAGDKVTVDLNHPLAGERLYFDVCVISVRPAADDELFVGRARAAESV